MVAFYTITITRQIQTSANSNFNTASAYVVCSYTRDVRKLKRANTCNLLKDRNWIPHLCLKLTSTCIVFIFFYWIQIQSNLIVPVCVILFRCTFKLMQLMQGFKRYGHIKVFKRCGAKGVYRQRSCQGITRKSAVLYRLLTQTIEAPKKRNRTVRVTNT